MFRHHGEGKQLIVDGIDGVLADFRNGVVFEQPGVEEVVDVLPGVELQPPESLPPIRVRWWGPFLPLAVNNDVRHGVNTVVELHCFF